MKRKFSPSRASQTELHGEFLPVEVRPGEPIRCQVIPQGSTHGQRVGVWRMSPFGLEVVETPSLDLRPGSKLSVQLSTSGGTTEYAGTVVAAGMHDKGKVICGIRIETSPRAERQADAMDQRGKTRWQSHRLFFPTGIASNRVRFGDRVLFRVSDVSADGLGLVTSLRNKHFHVGHELAAKITIPTVGEVDVRLRIMHVQVKDTTDGPQQVLGAKMLQPSRKVMSSLGQYVLQFGGDEQLFPTPKALAEQGFLVQSIAGTLDYDIVRTDEEYQQVLQLRSLAFQGVDGLGVSASPEQMADIYDARSRILICRYRGQVVATTRLCFHGPNDKFEEEEYVDFPSDFPPRELVVEASRAATHPDFRGSDLFLNIFRYVMLVTLQSGRRWIVQSTYGGLVPVYERVGFRQTGLRCPHPVFPGEKLHLLLGDCQSVLNGQVGNFLTWNTLVPEIRHLIESNSHIHLNWFAKKRLALYEAFTPVYRLYEKNRIQRRMRRQGLA